MLGRIKIISENIRSYQKFVITTYYHKLLIITSKSNRLLVTGMLPIQILKLTCDNLLRI